MTDLVSLLFIAMIPIDCKITKFFLTLVINVILVPWYKYNVSTPSTGHMAAL